MASVKFTVERKSSIVLLMRGRRLSRQAGEALCCYDADRWPRGSRIYYRLVFGAVERWWLRVEGDAGGASGVLLIYALIN